jgi:phosphatidylinositol glycan class K
MQARAAGWLTLLLVVTWTWAPPAAASYGGNHTSNWAVIVCTSRYWYNYRHMSNALSFYR